MPVFAVSKLIVLFGVVGPLSWRVVDSFAPRGASSSSFSSRVGVATVTEVEKPTGTSFLPKEAIERAEKGSPIEKAKLAKDGTAAFVDVYEYARKIREGEMTWEEVEKADMDTVRNIKTIEGRNSAMFCFVLANF